MGGLVPAPDHLHPRFAVLDEPHPESFSRGVTGTGNIRIALVLEPVFHDIPGELVSELEGLDEPLPLEIAQAPLSRQKHRVVETREGLPEILEPLFPPDVGVHWKSIAKRHVPRHDARGCAR